jgi:hypothetical protein
MIEKMVWFTTAAGRGLGVDIARDEPSHVHVPRRSRVMCAGQFVSPGDRHPGAAIDEARPREAAAARR